MGKYKKIPKDHNKLLLEAQKEMVEDNYSEYTVQKIYGVFYDWFENKIYSYIKKTDNFWMYPEEIQEKAMDMAEQALRWFINNPGRIIDYPLTYFHNYAFHQVMHKPKKDALDYTVNISYEDYMKSLEGENDDSYDPYNSL